MVWVANVRMIVDASSAARRLGDEPGHHVRPQASMCYCRSSATRTVQVATRHRTKMMALLSVQARHLEETAHCSSDGNAQWNCVANHELVVRT